VAVIARQLGARIAELMAVARQGEASQRTDRQPIQLQDLLSRVLEQQRGAAAQAGHQLVLKPASGLPSELLLHGDPEKLGQALTILLDNAIRYTPGPGQIWLSARLDEGASQALSLSVEDTGIGMSSEELSKATERYWRADAARDMRPEGMGLGLAIAKDIAIAHGGQLRLASRPEGGLLVQLSLPLG
jgi:signal transduction histidine kinase